MAEGDTARLVVWSRELRRVYARLRKALELTRAAVADGDRASDTLDDLLLLCHGFCTALDAHHQGEDRELFPAVAAAHPEVADVLHRLQQDHSMIAHLVAALRQATRQSAPPAEVARHLDGIGAIMESHFRYEERQLLTILETLELSADPGQVLGPL